MLLSQKSLLMNFCRILGIILGVMLLVSCGNWRQPPELIETHTPRLATSTPTAMSNPPLSTTVKISDEKPAPRSDSAMSYDSVGQKIVLVGGSTRRETYRDTWEYDGRSWKLITTNPPEIGFAPVMAYDQYRNKSVLFDWQSASIWEYDRNQWELIQTATKIKHLNWPAIAYNPLLRKIIIFGEWGDGESYEIWSYDGVDLKKIDSSHPYRDWGADGQAIHRIILPGLVYDPKNEEMILQPTYNWTFSWKHSAWETRVTEKESPLPTCDYRQVICFIPKLIYDKRREVVVLFDGEQTWEYAGENWIKIETLSAPLPRIGHAMAYDEARGVTVLFGGEDKNGEDLNDLWEYDGTTWVQR